MWFKQCRLPWSLTCLDNLTISHDNCQIDHPITHSAPTYSIGAWTTCAYHTTDACTIPMLIIIHNHDHITYPGPGSIGKKRPCSLSLLLRSSHCTPGWTTISKSSGWNSTILSMCWVKDIQMPPLGAVKWPSREVPPENAMIGTLIYTVSTSYHPYITMHVLTLTY